MTLCFQYLNTVIPFEKKGSPLSVEDLQMITKSKQMVGLNKNKPLKVKADTCLLLIQFSTPWRRTARRCLCCWLTTYWKVNITFKKTVLIPYLSKVSDTKTYSVWVHLSIPLSVLSSPLSYLKSHLTTRPTRFSDFLSISHPPFGLPTKLHDLQHGPSPSSSLYSPRLLTAAFCWAHLQP